MARTIRNTPDRDARTYYPTKRARQAEKRSDRHATRQTLHGYVR